MKITSEQEEILKQYIKDYQDIIKTDDINELLLAINDAILDNGFDDNQENLTDVGLKLQKTYDQIYNQN